MGKGHGRVGKKEKEEMLSPILGRPSHLLSLFFKARELFRMLPPRLPLCMLLPRILLLLSVLLWTVQGQRGRGPTVEGGGKG